MDQIVVGYDGSAGGDAALDSALDPEQAALHGGRPVLVVPTDKWMGLRVETAGTHGKAFY